MAAPPTIDYAPNEIVRISDFYVPQPKQEIFHLSGAPYRLAIGGFGSGKSLALLMEAIMHCLEYPGSNSIIVRKTVPDLKRTVVDKFLAFVPKAVYERGSQERGTYNASDHIVFFPPVPQFNPDGSPKVAPGGKQDTLQSKLYFAACERVEDVGKFLSTEFVFIGFEELGEFPFLIWDAFAGRNRCPIPGSRPCMAGATNPFGIGYYWIQKLWVKKKPVEGMTNYNPQDYWFVHSTVYDNPIYLKNKEYIAKLDSSPNREKILLGRLDAVSGQYFSNWDEPRHVLPRSSFIFEPWNPVWIGWDYGFGHYATLTFWTKAILKPRLEGHQPKLVNVTIHELWLKEHTPEEQTQALIAALPHIGEIIDMKRMARKGKSGEWYERNDDEEEESDADWKPPAPIDSIHFSWERFIATTKKNGLKRSIADDVGDLLSLHNIVRPMRGNTDRVAGWTKMFSMLDNDEWFILHEDTGNGIIGCPILKEAIPLAVRGDGVKTSLEDVVKPPGLSLNDDILDSARYAVVGVLLDEGEKPAEIKLRDKLAGIKDPMRRHVEAFKEWNAANAQRKRPPNQVIVPSWVNKVRQ